MENKQLELWNELKPNNTLQEVQQYLKEVSLIRGFADQDIKETMLLLTEEVGELAKAIRKSNTDMLIDEKRIGDYDSVESEIADVFIVLNVICNHLKVDLYNAVKNKEEINIQRNWK